MNESFEGWVESTVEKFNNQNGMRTGRMHPLVDYHGRKAAKMAWDHQQAKIDQLELDKNYLESSVSELLYSIRKLEGKE